MINLQCAGCAASRSPAFQELEPAPLLKPQEAQVKTQEDMCTQPSIFSTLGGVQHKLRSTKLKQQIREITEI
jgi:hypothetical protein